jgi:hypothetical protein
MTEKPIKLDPKELDVLDFDVIEEHWNEYELEDNTKLRGRVFLTRVARPLHGSISGKYALSFSTHFTSTALPNLRGSPGSPITPEEANVKDDDISSGIKMPVRILNQSEPWNIYRVDKTTEMFQVKLVVSAVYRLKDRYDQFGEPAYIIINKPLTSPVAKGYVKVDTKRKLKK